MISIPGNVQNGSIINILNSIQAKLITRNRVRILILIEWITLLLFIIIIITVLLLLFIIFIIANKWIGEEIT